MVQFILGVMVIAPWLAFLIYDAVLFIIRTITHEIPFVGGRARNLPRPRAPSLSERPSGHKRKFSIAVPGMMSSQESAADGLDGLKNRLAKSTSNAIEDE